ncbi:cupin domain-containing protein [uncultured Erythrobacter sp.]|uniref:cupin domain-containing protein n=1 Tax=uncultured Erythrobacter sp. TaxID=263913 RepID=UPI0026215EA2|nr:cupin domain-containing protein [uncultured Erythrobacter sp.]
MEINADFAKPALVHTNRLEWIASPMVGVDRRILDRIGGEVARATSIVRYAEGSAFPEHTHSGGEEFIVLEGVFQDEHGDYPVGTYVRNPVGTHHIPRSDPGCSIFVKLWQFDPDDKEQLVIDLNSAPLTPDPNRPVVSQHVLADRSYEHVSIEQWAVATKSELTDDGGLEVLILQGELMLDDVTYGLHDWLRIPAGETVKFTVGSEGARFWIKRGHLREIRIPDQVA